MWKSGYEDGFFLESPDERLRFAIEGLFQSDALFHEAGKGRTSEFELRRVRLEFSAAFERQFQFHIEPNFQADGVEMEEAWVGWLPDGRLHLLLGRMKEPFGLEESRPRRFVDFVNYSILNQFSPAEDHGITLLGNSSDGVLEYGAAIYNGSGEADANSGKDVAARIVLHPFAGGDGALRGLSLGGAATYGRQGESVAGDSLETETRVPFLEFAPGVFLDGPRRRYEAEAAWLHGPLHLQGEYLWVDQEMSLGAAPESIRFRGYYAQASYFLTGDEKKFSNMEPKNPVVSEGGEMRGTGGWQIAARFSQLHADSDLQSLGFVTPGMFSERTQSTTVALNWHINRHAMLRLDLVRTHFGDSVIVGGEGRTREDAFLAQFQIQF